MAKDASFELEGPIDHTIYWVQRRQYLPLLIRWLFHLVVLISVDHWYLLELAIMQRECYHTDEKVNISCAGYFYLQEHDTVMF